MQITNTRRGVQISINIKIDYLDIVYCNHWQNILSYIHITTCVDNNYVINNGIKLVKINKYQY